MDTLHRPYIGPFILQNVKYIGASEIAISTTAGKVLCGIRVLNGRLQDEINGGMNKWKLTETDEHYSGTRIMRDCYVLLLSSTAVDRV